jgi:hypothetical protein
MLPGEARGLASVCPILWVSSSLVCLVLLGLVTRLAVLFLVFSSLSLCLEVVSRVGRPGCLWRLFELCL